jgi:hypothetical protein
MGTVRAQQAEPDAQVRGAGLGAKDSMEIAFRAAIAVSLLAYTIGFMIVNLHLGRFGAADFGLVRSEYLLAGWVWVFLVGSGAMGVIYLKVALKERSSAWKTSGKRVRGFAAVAFEVLFLTSWATIPLTLLTEAHGWPVCRGALELALCGFLAAELFHTFGTAGQLLRVIYRYEYGTTVEYVDPPGFDRRWTGAPRKFFFYLPAGLLFCFFVMVRGYAHDVFPLISPTFGGGQLRAIEIIAKPDQVPMLEALGFSMRDHNTTQPLSLVTENDDFLLLMLPRGGRPGEALRVKKSSIEAVRYLASNSDRQ